MNEERMTKARLLQEMRKLRQRVSELERRLAGRCMPVRAAAKRPSPPPGADSSTRQKQPEDDLARNAKLLESALANMSDAVFITNADGDLIEFNEAFASYHRFSGKDDCVRHIAECFDRLDISNADGIPLSPDMWAVSRALRGERGENIEYIRFIRILRTFHDNLKKWTRTSNVGRHDSTLPGGNHVHEYSLPRLGHYRLRPCCNEIC